MIDNSVAVDPRQRRQARRTAFKLGLLACALYAGFVLYALRHGHA
jgi:hypothetical protein